MAQFVLLDSELKLLEKVPNACASAGLVFEKDSSNWRDAVSFKILNTLTTSFIMASKDGTG